MFIHNYVTNNLGTKPLAEVNNFLKKNDIIRFPGAVHAVASKAKREIEENVYNGPEYNETEFQMYFSKVRAECSGKEEKSVKKSSILTGNQGERPTDFSRHFPGEGQGGDEKIDDFVADTFGPMFMNLSSFYTEEEETRPLDFL